METRCPYCGIYELYLIPAEDGLYKSGNGTTTCGDDPNTIPPDGCGKRFYFEWYYVQPKVVAYKVTGEFKDGRKKPGYKGKRWNSKREENGE